MNEKVMEVQDRLQCHKCRKLRKTFFHFDSDSNRYCPRCAYVLRYSGGTIYDINSPHCPYDVLHSCFSRKQRIENAKNQIREWAERLKDWEEAEELEEHERRLKEQSKEDDITILDSRQQKLLELNKRLYWFTDQEIREYKKRMCGVCLRHEKDFEDGRILETNGRAQKDLYGGCNKCWEAHQAEIKEKQRELNSFKDLVEKCAIGAVKASCRAGKCRCGKEGSHICLQKNKECTLCKSVFDPKTFESRFTKQSQLCIECGVSQQDDPEAMLEDMKEEIKYAKKWEREWQFEHLNNS